jgi:AsmA protein
MSQYLKYALTVFALVITLLVGLLLYITTTFDPNAYKPQIIQLVKENNQRELRFDGNIKLTFFPSLGISVENISMNEYNSDKEFAAAENVLVSLALLPLLKKQLVVKEITLKGLKANLVRFRDGRMNIDDLITKRETSEQFNFDIDRVRVEKTTLVFRDEASGREYTFMDVNLKVDTVETRSRSVDDTIRSNVELAFSIEQADQPEMSLVTRLEFGLMSNFGKQHYTVDDFHFESTGKFTGIDNLVINSTGDFSIQPAEGKYVLSKLTLGITGLSDMNNVDIKFDAPRLNLIGEEVAGDKISLVVKATNAESSAIGSLSLLDVDGIVSDFKSALTGELELKKGDQLVKVVLASPLAGNLDTLQLHLPGLVAVISADNPGAPENSVSGKLIGSAFVDGVSQDAQTTLSGTFTGSNIKANLAAKGFFQPIFNFDVDIDQLDLDRFLPQPRKGGKHVVKAENAERLEKSLDLSGLRNLNVKGAIRIGLLKFGDVNSSKVKLDINM